MMDLGNEFAWVQLELDNTGLSPRLKIHDMRSGNIGYLDAFELVMLAQVRHEDLKPLMDPGFQGWEQDGQTMSEFLEELGMSSMEE
jgi:hypothetical protein